MVDVQFGGTGMGLRGGVRHGFLQRFWAGEGKERGKGGGIGEGIGKQRCTLMREKEKKAE